MAAAGRIEKVPGMNQRDRMLAVLAAQAFDEALREDSGVAGPQQMGSRDAQLGADLIDFLAPRIGLDGAAEFSQGVGADADLVLDGVIRMAWIIQVHGVLGIE